MLWILAAAATNILVAKLEIVGASRAVPMSPQDAPSVIAMKHVGEKFEEFHSDSVVMIVLESDTPLGDIARQYYRAIIQHRPWAVVRHLSSCVHSPRRRSRRCSDGALPVAIESRYQARQTALHNRGAADGRTGTRHHA